MNKESASEASLGYSEDSPENLGCLTPKSGVVIGKQMVFLGEKNIGKLSTLAEATVTPMPEDPLGRNVIISSFVVNPFDNVSHMCETWKLPQSKFAQGWRLVKSEIGEVNGLPSSRGILVATDGMLCLVYQSEKSFFLGHNEWWQSDERDEQGVREEEGLPLRRLLAKTTKDFLDSVEKEMGIL